LESISDYRVIVAKSGEECFQILNKGEKPDLIMLDIMMPEIDGWNLYKMITETKECESIPIIFLSAKNDELTKKRGNLISCDFIEKPFEITELKKRIDHAIQD
jgi:DNA-binding response OmpR family regulator